MRNDAPQAKLGLLAAVMVGILAASVALAWLTTKPQKDTSPVGAEIISKLAADTLDAYRTGHQGRTVNEVSLVRNAGKLSLRPVRFGRTSARPA